MTLLSELIDIPARVHRSDFVISLETAISEPDKTMRDYVVTDQLASCFDGALSLVATAVVEAKSKAAYLHASFGGGKTAMMAVLDLLLRGEPAARSVPELAPVISRYASRLDGRRFLLVPYHFIGKKSMEQAVLGGYVDHVRAVHPDAPLPAVYVTDLLLDDARSKRDELGDDVFFRMLSRGEVADEWGEYGAGWDADRFDKAMATGPGTTDRQQLVSALLRSLYRALPGQAEATGEGFVPLDAGLNVISRHARGLGYDAVVLFLDEIMLWLESRISEPAFVTREGNKIVQLVEGDVAERPVPIVSFLARQRDLRELVGEHVLGPEARSAMDFIGYTSGRFDLITLEDRNLPAIAEKRLLRPRSEQARQQLDDAFAGVRAELEERHERDILLTDTSDLDTFRRLYPFSPALVDALVALSSAMQRERTALKVMLQLLVDGRDSLELGQLVPLGDLWDAITGGDVEEPLTEVMRAQLAQARRLWSRKFQPLLLREHGLTEDEAARATSSHPYVTDARLLKSLLVAALVPAAGPLRSLTVSRLTALNSGIVRAFIPGTERQQVLDKLRRWEMDVADLRLSGDDQDPTVAVVLSGIDTGPILEAARIADTAGERRRRLRDLLFQLVQIKDVASLDPWAELVWRGTRRRVDVVFANVRDPVDLPDEMFRAGNDSKIVIDYPWDAEEYGPTSDRGRAVDFRAGPTPEWAAVWLPNFFTEATRDQVGRLVKLDYILAGETFEQLASYLAPADRAVARSQLEHERESVIGRLETALRQSYGVDPVDSSLIEEVLPPGEQVIALDPALTIQPPVGTTLRAYLEGVGDQLLKFRYPQHPEFTEFVTKGDLTNTLAQVILALQQPNGRLENVDPPMRRVLAKVAGPLKVGTMHQAHFVADASYWTDLLQRRLSESGVTVATVGQVRRWLDGSGTATDRRGLTAEVADVLVLVVAMATSRALAAAGQPVARAEIGRLRDDWELRPQELPAPNVWEVALQRAEDMGVVPPSRLRSATSVAGFSQRVLDEIVDGRDRDVRDLVPRMEAAYARFEVDDDDRLATAKAALALVEELRSRPDDAAGALARCDPPTTAAALGTSIKQAPAVAAELDHTNWDLILGAAALAGEFEREASALRQRLIEALRADDLVISLVDRLRDASRAATDLLKRAVRPGPTPPTEPEPGMATFDRASAEKALVHIRDRLRAEAHLDLRWEILELDNDAAG
jgi:hypothetical protein